MQLEAPVTSSVTGASSSLPQTARRVPWSRTTVASAASQAVAPGCEEVVVLLAEQAPSGPTTESRVLLLNISLEPLCVVSLNRAVVLVMAGKATVLEAAGVLRSARATMPAPVVLSLTRYVHVPNRRPVPPTRRTVLARDDHRCAYCGGGADTVDHVHPRSRGGAHEWGNVVAACVRCNHRKADRLLHELGWELGFTPRPPRWSLTIAGPISRTDPAWSRYLTV
jgi:5-methylcytosine-specific restriction endonuclease McrA